MAFWNRKNNQPAENNVPEVTVQMNSSLYRDITQEVAMFMLSAKITEDSKIFQ